LVFARYFRGFCTPQEVICTCFSLSFLFHFRSHIPPAPLCLIGPFRAANIEKRHFSNEPVGHFFAPGSHLKGDSSPYLASFPLSFFSLSFVDPGPRVLPVYLNRTTPWRHCVDPCFLRLTSFVDPPWLGVFDCISVATYCIRSSTSFCPFRSVRLPFAVRALLFDATVVFGFSFFAPTLRVAQSFWFRQWRMFPDEDLTRLWAAAHTVDF